MEMENNDVIGATVVDATISVPGVLPGVSAVLTAASTRAFEPAEKTKR